MSSSKGANSINYEAVICNGCLESLQAIPGHATDRRIIQEKKGTKEKNLLLDHDSCPIARW